MRGTFNSQNLTTRLRERQFCAAAPGTAVNRARNFYQNVVPSYRIPLDIPLLDFCTFSRDGKYFITIQSVDCIVGIYKPHLPSFSVNSEDFSLPADGNQFSRHFIECDRLVIGHTSPEFLLPFFLYSAKNGYGIFLTSIRTPNDVFVSGAGIGEVRDSEGTVRPSGETIAVHPYQCVWIVNLETGNIVRQKEFENDLIKMEGISVDDDILAVVSLAHHRINFYLLNELEWLTQDGLDPITNICEHIHAVDLNDTPLTKDRFYYRWNDHTDLYISGVLLLVNNRLMIRLKSIRKLPSFFAGFRMETQQTLLPALFVEYNIRTAEARVLQVEAAYNMLRESHNEFIVPSKPSQHLNFISTSSNSMLAREYLKWLEELVDQGLAVNDDVGGNNDDAGHDEDMEDADDDRREDASDDEDIEDVDDEDIEDASDDEDREDVDDEDIEDVSDDNEVIEDDADDDGVVDGHYAYGLNEFKALMLDKRFTHNIISASPYLDHRLFKYEHQVFEGVTWAEDGNFPVCEEDFRSPIHAHDYQLYHPWLPLVLCLDNEAREGGHHYCMYGRTH